VIDLLETERAQAFLNQKVPAIIAGQIDVHALSVLAATARPSLYVHYALDLVDRLSGQRRKQLLTIERFAGADLDSAAFRLEQQIEKLPPKDTDLTKFVAKDLDRELLIYPFPLDAKLYCLPLAADPQASLEKLRVDCPELVDGFPGSHASVHVLRYVPGRRCQLRYVLGRDDSTSLTFLGKIFRGDRGQQAFDLLEKVARFYTSSGEGQFFAPKPLAYLSDWKMVIQEHIDGATLNQMVRTGLAGNRHFSAAAGCIARLHNSKIEVNRYHGIGDELEILEKSLAGVDEAGLSDHSFSLTLDKIQEFAVGLTPSRFVTVHRDFYDKQLIMDGQRTALIDLDTLSMGCPEIDVANFLAHLDLRYLQRGTERHRSVEWRDAFLAEYRVHGKPLNSVLVTFFTATTYFRLACRYRLISRGEALARTLLRLADLQVNRNLDAEWVHVASGKAVIL